MAQETTTNLHELKVNGNTIARVRFFVSGNGKSARVGIESRFNRAACLMRNALSELGLLSGRITVRELQTDDGIQYREERRFKSAGELVDSCVKLHAIEKQEVYFLKMLHAHLPESVLVHESNMEKLNAKTPA